NTGGTPMETWSSPRMGVVHETESGSPGFLTKYEASGMTLDGLADLLTVAAVGPEPVLNATGERRKFQITLEISKASLQALPRPRQEADVQNAILQAANNGLKNLGLQLERRKVPVEMLVIDHLDQTPTDKAEGRTMSPPQIVAQSPTNPTFDAATVKLMPSG